MLRKSVFLQRSQARQRRSDRTPQQIANLQVTHRRTRSRHETDRCRIRHSRCIHRGLEFSTLSLGPTYPGQPNAESISGDSVAGSSLPSAAGIVIRILDLLEPLSHNLRNVCFHRPGRQHSGRFRQSRRSAFPNRRSRVEVHTPWKQWDPFQTVWRLPDAWVRLRPREIKSYAGDSAARSHPPGQVIGRAELQAHRDKLTTRIH